MEQETITVGKWLADNLFAVISLLFGTGGIGYAIIARVLDRKKYKQEVKEAEASANLKGDEFWKQRYEILQKEITNKDEWWKERYESLKKEYDNERRLSNEIVQNFRNELNIMRDEYDKQRELERQKYNLLVEQYRTFEEESLRKEKEYKDRIRQLEELVSKYERRIEHTEPDSSDGQGN